MRDASFHKHPQCVSACRFFLFYGEHGKIMERNGKSLGKMFESKTNAFEKFPNDVMADGIKFYN